MKTCIRTALVAACALIVVPAFACSSGDEDTPAAGGPVAGVGTQEELARMAVKSLRAGSLDPFEAALPVADDLEAALQSLRRAEGEEKYRIARKAMEESGGLEQAAEQMRRKCREGLDGLRQKLPGTVGLVDWSKAEFDGMNEAETRLKVQGGVEGGDIRFRVKVGEKRYEMVLMTCMKLDRGWVCGNGIRLHLRMEDVHPGR